jgi:hypothetical protein
MSELDTVRAKAAETQARIDGAKYGSPLRGGASRMIEDSAFFLGLLLIASRATVEMGQEIGYWPMPADHHSAWATLLEFLRASLLVAPKTLGRATAGGVWGAIGSGVGKMVGRGGKPSTEESDK